MSCTLARRQPITRNLQPRSVTRPGCRSLRPALYNVCSGRETRRACSSQERTLAEGTAAAGSLLATAALRSGLASVALAACLVLPLSASPVQAAKGMVAEAGALEQGAAAASGSSSSGLQTVYFGNGCFWGRQKDFVDVEMRQLGRSPESLTALVGYAAGTKTGPGGKVCYVYSDPRTHYDSLGHAEVVQLGVSADPVAAEAELRAFAARYFDQFRQTRFGMQRSDPQDRGPAYRNVIGIPGGVSSPYYHVIQEANKYGMELREGRGNNMGQQGRPTEDDILNTVWVVDSGQLPFYRAERYHQFHHGLGKLFPLEYVRDLRNTVAGLGRIESTGCPELPF